MSVTKVEVDDDYTAFKSVLASFGPAEQMFYWVQGGGAVTLHAFVRGGEFVVRTVCTSSPPSSGTITTDFPQALGVPVTNIT